MMTAFTLKQNEPPIITSQSGGFKISGGEKNKNGSSNNKTKMYPLPLDFMPRTNDVICAKGNDAKEHIGNIKFRHMINELSESYGKATSRHQKTAIVNQIMDSIHNNDGAFIRYDGHDGCWYEVSEPLAREKVGQRLREKNHSQYKSSTKSKRKFRKDLNQKAFDKMSTVVKTNVEVSAALHELSTFLENHNSNTTTIQNQFQMQTMIPPQLPQEQMMDSTASLSSSSTANSPTSLDVEDVEDYDHTEEGTSSSSSDPATVMTSDMELEMAMTKANSQILASLKNDKSIQDMIRDGSDSNYNNE